MLKYIKRKRKTDPATTSKKRKLTFLHPFNSESEVKIISWNVNGMKSLLRDSKENILRLLDEEKPTFLGLQETKLQDTSESTFSHAYMFDDYKGYFHHCKRKKGYSGVAVYVKTGSSCSVKKITRVFGKSEIDEEGRMICLETEKFYLVNVYVPNSGENLKRLKFRLEWDKTLFEYVRSLEKKKPVCLIGDLNVVHKDKDIFLPIHQTKNFPGASEEERHSFQQFLRSSSFIDTFEHLYPRETNRYSHFSYRNNEMLRKQNKGWRIDYCVVSCGLEDSIREAFVTHMYEGSDHFPVGVILSHKNEEKTS